MRRKLFSIIVTLLAAIILVACESVDPDPDPNPDPDLTDGQLTWTGLETKPVVRGDRIDLKDGIVVVDTIDGDLSDQIEVIDDGNFDTNFADVYTVTYEVTNSTGITEQKTKQFSVTIGHNLANNDFEMNNAYGWTTDKPGGVFEVTFQDGQAQIAIENAGTSWWGLQLYQRNVIFKANTTYLLTVTASSPDGHSIAVGYEDPNNNFAMLNPGTLNHKLEEEAKTFELYYTALVDYADVKVVIYLGNKLDDDHVADPNEPHMVYIEEIYIEEVTLNTNVVFTGNSTIAAASGGFEFDVLSNVSATAGETDLTDQIEVLGEIPTYVRANAAAYVTFLIRHEDGSVSFANRRFNYTIGKEHPHQAVNGDFSQGLIGWVQDVNQTDGNGAATYSENEDGTVSILVTSVSTAGWHIQLNQAGIQLTAGQTYRVAIRLKASQARTVTIEMVNPSAGFANLMSPLNIAVTQEYQTFEVIFTASANASGRLGILLGRIQNTPNNITVTIDEFQVYLAEDEDEPVITGATDFELNVGDSAPNWLDGVTATDAIDGNVVVTIKENTVNLAEAGTYTITYAATDKAGNEATVTVDVVVHPAADDAFTWNGLTQDLINHGDDFDLLANITVFDHLENDITATLTVTDNGGFNVSTAGSYTITYSAENGVGTVKTQTRILTVDARYKPQQEQFNAKGPWMYDRISAAISGGILTVTFDTAPGGNPWDHQLYQNSGSTLKAGVTYQVEVRLRSSVDRTVRAWIEDVNKGYSAIVTDARTEIILEADTWSILTYQITITEGLATTNAKYVVMLGKPDAAVGAHTVDIDYFVVTIVEPE